MGFGGKFLEEKLYKCSLHENCTVHYFFSDNIWDKLIGQKKNVKEIRPQSCDFKTGRHPVINFKNIFQSLPTNICKFFIQKDLSLINVFMF